MEFEKKDPEMFGKYSVEWSLNNGSDIDWECFFTLKDAKRFLKQHINDKEKEDLHIKKWKRVKYINAYGWEEVEWELIDTYEPYYFGIEPEKWKDAKPSDAVVPSYYEDLPDDYKKVVSDREIPGGEY